MCHYFHPTISSKFWRTWSAMRNRWVRCFTSWVFFLISWTLGHRTIVPCNKNTENTLQHPVHMHSHVPINAKTNTVRREERINALQSYTLQNLGFWPKNVTQTFWSGSKISQTYIYWMEMRNKTNFSLFLMRRCIAFLRPCLKLTIKGYFCQKKQRKNWEMLFEALKRKNTKY